MAEGHTAGPPQEYKSRVHNDVLEFPHHLGFGDPEGDLGDGDNKIMDLDAIKLCNGKLDGVVGKWIPYIICAY